MQNEVFSAPASNIPEAVIWDRQRQALSRNFLTLNKLLPHTSPTYSKWQCSGERISLFKILTEFKGRPCLCPQCSLFPQSQHLQCSGGGELYPPSIFFCPILSKGLAKRIPGLASPSMCFKLSAPARIVRSGVHTTAKLYTSGAS